MNLNATSWNDNLISEIFIVNHAQKKFLFAASCVGFALINVFGLRLAMMSFLLK